MTNTAFWSELGPEGRIREYIFSYIMLLKHRVGDDQFTVYQDQGISESSHVNYMRSLYAYMSDEEKIETDIQCGR